jgi:hypothetical protein
VRGQKKVFDTTEWYDYPVAFILAAVVSFLGSVFISMIGFFTILLAPVVGTIIGEVVRRAVRRRRSKRLHLVTLAAVVIGGLPSIILPLITILVGGGLGALYSLLWPSIYLFLAASTTYYRISGIQFSR